MYMGNYKINHKTDLKASDILKSPDGKYYQILSNYSDNTGFRLTSYPDDHSQKFIPDQFVIFKQVLIAKKWEKVDEAGN
jgi:hypothetical protein